MFTFIEKSQFNRPLFNDFMDDAFTAVDANFPFSAGLNDVQKKNAFYVNLNNIASAHFGWQGEEDGWPISMGAGIITGQKMTVLVGIFRKDALGSMDWTSAQPHYQAHNNFLRAEGIPVGSGYRRTMYENPLFAQKTAFGAKGYPFSAVAGTPPEYRKGDCPTAEKLISERFIWFYHVHRPNSEKDMADVVSAMRKVHENRNALKEWDPTGKALTYKW